MFRANEQELIRGLRLRQSAITLPEFDVISNRISGDGRITGLVYLNRYGEVRWFREGADHRPGFPYFGEYRPPDGVPTPALLRAYRTNKMAFARDLGGGSVEVAWPVLSEGNLLGVLDAHVALGK